MKTLFIMGNNLRQRHGFVTAWLILSVIASVILMLLTLRDAYHIYQFCTDVGEEFPSLVLVSCVGALCTVGGYILLLCWKKRGFSVLVTVQLVVVINNLFTMSDNIFIIDNEILFYTQYIIAPIVSVLVLLLILQIKKNGVSYWKAMDSDAPLLTFNAPQGGPYCPKCGSKNLETSNFCTSCGAALKYSAPATPSTPPAPSSPQVTPAAPVTEPPVIQQADPAPKTNRRWIWVVLLAVVLVGAVVFFLTRNSENSSEYHDADYEECVSEDYDDVVPAFPSEEEYFPLTGTYYGHEWVDLGLSSGLKWATCNVGASSPEDFGDHFAWGELKSVESGNTKARLNGETNKEDSFDISGSWAYDAARVNWGGYWRIPSSDECEELISECIWRWVTKNGVDGYEVTGLTGKSIFLPAAALGRNGFGYYWSSTGVTNPFAADYIAFGNEFLEVSPWGGRDSGMTIRPVYSDDTSLEEPIPSSDTFYRKGVLSVNGVIYPMAYVEGDGFDFYIGKYEVTQELWEEVMGTDVIEQRDKANPKWSLRGVGDDYPMYYVNYYEAVEFCNKLKQLTGRSFSLPAEDQWEFAAKGGLDGYGEYCGEAWYKDNSNATTHEVGGLTPNELGLYDMCGNVREWCDGWNGSKRALRGGGWFNAEDEATATSQYYDAPEVRDNNYGFRICLDI